MSKEDPAFLQSMFKALEKPLGKADKRQEVYTKLREAVGVKNAESVREFDPENPDDRSFVGLSDRSQARAVARCLQSLVPASQAPAATNNNAPPISKGENPVFAKAKAATGPSPSSAPPSAVASPPEKAPSSAVTAPQHPRPAKPQPKQSQSIMGFFKPVSKEESHALLQKQEEKTMEREAVRAEGT
uniref:Uncharacterized protein n=1 Tax=Chromera velia CCMP2878 TaxID=1169474 RepID=A0A0G4HP72_9ALVE|eukprot:Cvel_29856.t1-p1 / transcript=Cvel_29856.t1 / gene=Cvel_29856 / organism=Chromera_velia_CCMP2878 / gene_product=hypothetical protein / transcript_product=hypothetical protein / location=Cvel_scaffold4165:1585-2142(-) / protein_length=186 / sequence_SO=supercontig / SO=protein_coding / is_pseudo=false